MIPCFWLLNQFTTPATGFPNPIYFTATAMIGMIALAGIVVRNSIILIDFIERIRARADATLAEALIEAGAIRLRPIFLTAGAGHVRCVCYYPGHDIFRAGMELHLWYFCFDPVFITGDSGGLFFD
jgi:multidrug efflux pump subunit AcrB